MSGIVMPRITAIIILIVAIAVLAIFFGIIQLALVPSGPALKLDVSPDAIPPSGTWAVTSYLAYPNNRTETSVNSTVTMTATLKDGTRAVITRVSLAGVASFPVPSDTIGATFDGHYQNYTGSDTISGPTVISEGYAEGYVSLGILAGIAYLDSLGKRFGELRANKTKLMILGILLPSIAFSFPLAYLGFVFPPWFGKGWSPATLFGIPIYSIVLIPALVAIASYIASYFWRSNP